MNELVTLPHSVVLELCRIGAQGVAEGASFYSGQAFVH